MVIWRGYPHWQQQLGTSAVSSISFSNQAYQFSLHAMQVQTALFYTHFKGRVTSVHVQGLQPVTISHFPMTSPHRTYLRKVCAMRGVLRVIGSTLAAQANFASGAQQLPQKGIRMGKPRVEDHT